MKYTKNELLEAKFFEATLDIYGKTDYAESYQTKFKDFYCESCGVHQLIPGEAVCINKTEFRGKDIAVSKKINNEIIVSDRMKKLIESAGLTGVKFVPVHHYNNRLKNDYPAWHMIVTSIMPPIEKVCLCILWITTATFAKGIMYCRCLMLGTRKANLQRHAILIYLVKCSETVGMEARS